MHSVTRMLTRLTTTTTSQLLPFAAASSTALNTALVRELHTTDVDFRARQGTRIRKRKEAMKNRKDREERLRKNPPPLPAKVLLMLKAKRLLGPWRKLRPDESDLEFPLDNVYFTDDFCHRRYTLEEAVNELRAHYEPPLLDRLDELIHAKIEFDLSSSKTDRYLEEFSKMVPIAHQYNPNAIEKEVMVFAADEALQKEATEAGAKLVGGEELIEEIKKGRVELADFDQFVCHDELFIKMNSLAGLLRERTPSLKTGTVGKDIRKLVRTFKTGINVDVKTAERQPRVEADPSYGYCEVPFANFEMPIEQMEENLDLILETLQENRPRRKTESKKGWVTRIVLKMVDGPHYAEFALKHPLIHDPKLREFEARRLKEEGNMTS